MDSSLATGSAARRASGGLSRGSRRWRRVVLVAFAAAVVTAGSAAGAQAGGTPRPDPGNAVGTATVTTGYGGPLGGIRPDVLPGDGGGTACQTAWVKRTYSNFLGWQMWAYLMQVHWCFNGVSVLSIDRVRWVECCFPGWAFDGHISTYFPSPLGNPVRSFTQGRFHFGVGITTYVYPWLILDVYANGGYAASTGQ